MRFNDDAIIIREKQIPDNYGGYTIIEEYVCDIKVVTAPYSVGIGEICMVPNPISTIKFFTDSIDIDEDMNFYIIYKGVKYKKISISNYGKCILILGERI